MTSLTTINAHALSLIMNLLPFSNMSGMPRVCITMRDLCAAIDGGWHSFVESRIVRFTDNTRYFTTPSGWMNYIHVYTVKLPKNKKRSAGAGRTIYVGTKRHKLRMRGGVEYAQLGEDHRYPSIYASDNNIDEKRIREQNGHFVGRTLVGLWTDTL